MKELTLQYDLSPELPNIYGHLDYREFQKTLQKIDEILKKSGLEDQLVDQALAKMAAQNKEDSAVFFNGKSGAYYWKNLRYALRCTIARHLMGESFRKFSIRLADSSLLQWFTGICAFGQRRAVSKSSLSRYSRHFSVSMLEEQIHHWQSSFLSDAKKAEIIGLNQAIEGGSLFMDSACVKANIHFPVDWVLLRDAARSLLSAIKMIRAQGLKHRMMAPALLMRQMNRLCIEMTHTRRRNDSKRQRKSILRKMKQLSLCIKKHAERYRQLLMTQQEKTTWSPAQVKQVTARMDNILDQLPAAIRQAHERIIGERVFPSDQKRLSLYEKEARVIVRGKAGSEVEFGQGLLLAEQKDGLLVDWKLFKDQPPTDSQLLEGAIRRIEKRYGRIQSVCTDRAFYSQANEQFLKKQNIYSAVCPKSPRQLQERTDDWRFLNLQTRRSQTEARIGIFKNVFLGKPLRSKGFLNKELTVHWCVLTHNLWVIARMALADERTVKKKAA